MREQSNSCRRPPRESAREKVGESHGQIREACWAGERRGGVGVVLWVEVRYVRPPGFGRTVVLGFGVAFPGAIRCNGESISKRDIVRVVGGVFEKANFELFF